MDRATGDALEWALALLRAPAERYALRERPLPGGMERLLALAGGIQSDASADAARALGESESTLRDAARFYAREVLFFPQADAYRVLGLERGAGNEQIKLHHRLLQQWLHPDRPRSEDDSVFSARVNSAWNHLRTEERRQAYDLARREERAPEVFDSNGALRRLPAWAGEPLPVPMTPERRLRRLVLLGIFGACMVMAWLIVRDGDAQHPDAWADLLGQEEAQGDAGDAIGIRVPERPSTAEERGSTSPKSPQSGPRVSKTEARVVSTSTILHAEVRRPAVPPVAEASRVPVEASVARPVDIVPLKAIARSQPGATEESPDVPAQRPPAAAVPVMPPVASPVVIAAGAAAERVPSAPPKVAAPTGPAADGVAQELFARTQLARQAGEQLIRYLSARNRLPPPIWNSPSIQAGADRLRNDLHGEGKAKLLAPQWRVATTTAAMTARYRMDGEDSRSGQVTADLVWREGRWLVTGLSMDRPQ